MPKTADSTNTDGAKPWQGPIKVDLSEWTTMGPILDWQTAARSGNFAAMCKTMTEIVKSWPSEHDPAEFDSYRLITRDEWKAVAREVGQAVTNFFQD